MHRMMRRMAVGFAVLGGAVLCALIALTCLSVLGREIGAQLPGAGLGPIPGDFEVVEAGRAFGLFAFLPLAQLDRAHASVDVFTSRLPRPAGRALSAVIDLLFAVVLVVLAVQLFAGMLSKRESGQTSFLLEFPIWCAYAASCVGAGSAAVTGVYLAISRIAECFLARDLLPPPPVEGRRPSSDTSPGEPT